MTDSSTMTMNEAPRVPVVLDLEAGTIGTDTHVRPLPESADAALAAYLDLVYEMRDRKGGVVPLRHDDVEILAVGLALDTDEVVGRLVQLMGSEKEARGLLERLKSGKVLIPAGLLFAGVIGLGAIAAASGSGTSGGSVGTKSEPTTITAAATTAPATAAPVTTAAPPATTAAPPATTAAPPATAAPPSKPIVKTPATTAAPNPAPVVAPTETTAPYVPPAPYRPIGGTPTVDVGGSGGAAQVGDGATAQGGSDSGQVEQTPPTVAG